MAENVKCEAQPTVETTVQDPTDPVKATYIGDAKGVVEPRGNTTNTNPESSGQPQDGLANLDGGSNLKADRSSVWEQGWRTCPIARVCRGGRQSRLRAEHQCRPESGRQHVPHPRH